MKFILFLLLSFAAASTARAQAPAARLSVPDTTKTLLLVDASCGQCRLGLPGKDCDLAIRLNGKAYFVDGTTIDSHGDAHANNGFCNTVRKAEAQGAIVDNRFKATYFKLLPDTGKSK